MQRPSDLQLEQHGEVFLYCFHDPIVDYLESLSSSDVKSFFLSECWFCCLFELHFCMPCIPPFIRSRSRILPINQFLVWIHWKHEFTWSSNNINDSVSVEVYINKLAMQVFGFQFKYIIQFAFGLQLYVLFSAVCFQNLNMLQKLVAQIWYHKTPKPNGYKALVYLFLAARREHAIPHEANVSINLCSDKFWP